MPDRLTEASGEFVEAINDKIALASAAFSQALSVRDRDAMARARARMTKFADLRERFFSFIEEIVFDETETPPEASEVAPAHPQDLPPPVTSAPVAEAPIQETAAAPVSTTPTAPVPEVTREAPRTKVVAAPVNEVISTRSPSARALAAWPKARPGRVSAANKSHTQEPAEALVTGEYTEVKDYEPYLLRAMVLLGDNSRFVDIQKKTLSLMDADDSVKPQDRLNVGKTTIPRYISQTSSLRKSLMRREIIVQHSDKTFSLTPKGEEEARRTIADLPELGLRRNRVLAPA